MFNSLFKNITTVLRAMVLPFRVHDGLAATLPQIVVALLLNLAVAVAFQVALAWPVGDFDIFGAMGQFTLAFLNLLAICFAVLLIGAARRGLELLIAVLIAQIVPVLVFIALYATVPNLLSSLAVLATIAVLPVVLAVVGLLQGRLWTRGLRAVVVGGGVFGLTTLSQLTLPIWPMFTPNLPQDVAATAEATDMPPVDTERLYYAQGEFMDRALDGMAAGRPGTAEVFGLTLGGTSHQRVFLREARAVAGILSEKYDAADRMVTLVNSAAEPFSHPMANHTNLRSALLDIGAKMQRDEDLTFLYLTSHGSPDRFSLSFYEAGTHPLPASELAALLSEAQLGYTVIVISACYAGSFIDELQGPKRIIITAASAEDKSFGCSDTAEWTYWGRAFFDEAMRQETEIQTAFRAAAETVTRWETEQGKQPSNPQISVGAEIADYLAQTRLTASAEGVVGSNLLRTTAAID